MDLYRKSHSQISLFFRLRILYWQEYTKDIIANKVHSYVFEEAFLPLYCLDNGRPAKPISLMVGLLILKHIRKNRQCPIKCVSINHRVSQAQFP